MFQEDESLNESSALLPSRKDGLTIHNKSEREKPRIGVFSAVFIIFNRIIGTGIFATPSMILGLSGSVGLSLYDIQARYRSACL
ncbi:hypothetical protein DFP72DRAFT_921489 [Ephemerocybe angulata]|uniref:Uncharacterized protein n=1 Tax=Ephemerocybe angulata TaxID=980116 RepID=A0A8H6LZL8_9AGAR|nr:hypothetical protein DFP72DRAFT_921489 [Tulosesus angulatus]